jgi:hypothetical protein
MFSLLRALCCPLVTCLRLRLRRHVAKGTIAGARLPDHVNENAAAVGQVWYIVPGFIFTVGHLFFPVLVYGYFVTSRHAAGAMHLLGSFAVTTAIWGALAAKLIAIAAPPALAVEETALDELWVRADHPIEIIRDWLSPPLLIAGEHALAAIACTHDQGSPVVLFWGFFWGGGGARARLLSPCTGCCRPAA